MGESQNGSAEEGTGVLPGRASVPTLSDRANLTSREVEALAKRLIKTNNPDLLEEIGHLTPRMKAHLTTTPEWSIIVKALAVDVTIGATRITQSQMRGIGIFQRGTLLKDKSPGKKSDETYDAEATPDE